VAVSLAVLVLEVADDQAGLEQGVPVVAVEALLAQKVVERLDVPAHPRTARWNVGDASLAIAKALQRLRKLASPRLLNPSGFRL
jgi:hypothetical protein